MSNTNCQLIYSTCGSLDEAEQIGRALVADRLVACVNILPEMISVYQWQGVTEQGREVVLLAKTTVERTREVIAKIESLHSYDCPAVVAIDLQAGAFEYLDWVKEQVQE